MTQAEPAKNDLTVMEIHSKDWREKSITLVDQARAIRAVILVTSYGAPRLLVLPLRERLNAVGPKRFETMTRIAEEVYEIRTNMDHAPPTNKVRTIGSSEFRRQLADTMWKIHQSVASFLTTYDAPIALMVTVHLLGGEALQYLISELRGVLYGQN